MIPRTAKMRNLRIERKRDLPRFTEQVGELQAEPDLLPSAQHSAADGRAELESRSPYRLRKLRHVTSPLHTSVFSTAKWRWWVLPTWWSCKDSGREFSERIQPNAYLKHSLKLSDQCYQHIAPVAVITSFSQAISPFHISNREFPSISQDLQRQEIALWPNSAVRAWGIIIFPLWEQPFLKFLVWTFPNGRKWLYPDHGSGSGKLEWGFFILSMSHDVVGTSWGVFRSMFIHITLTGSFRGLLKPPDLSC